MGREIKRVAAKFDWPLGKVWKGFLNPHWKRCEVCDGACQTIAGQRLDDLVSLLMLSGEDARRQRCHPYFNEAPLFYTQGKTPSPDMADLTVALAGRDMGSFGHDSIDQWSARKRILKAAGMSEDWGQCPACHGNGCDPAHYEAHEAWQETSPPAGDWWQVWETVSEGSPVTPAFATADGLIEYLVAHGDCSDQRRGDGGWRRDAAADFVKSGWSPSGIATSAGFFGPKDMDLAKASP